MSDNSIFNVHRAIQDFRSARQKATLREIIARIRGESTELLSFTEVRQQLKAQVSSKKVLKEIPISAIIGSENRYQDFMRGFLPREGINEERWANVEAASIGLEGLPPIEAYQIDQVYFVSDGNHRVSVAKQLGATEIQAYVTEVKSRVSLSADIHPEDIILKAEYAEFLEDTNLDKERPGADLTVTSPGQYEVLEEHISVHRYFMGIEQQHEIPYQEAVNDWYDKVYSPIVTIIRERGLLMDFPNRTEADLYLWIADHRAALEADLNTQVNPSSAAADLADQYSQRFTRVVSRWSTKIGKAITPNVLEAGPPIGEWRVSITMSQREERLFCEILVPINGLEEGWNALEQSLLVAQREGANLHGLFVIKPDDNIDFQAIQAEFTNRCQNAGVPCDLRSAEGDITSNICERARWVDLVIVNLAYPPETSTLSRLTSGIRNLIHRCPRPILFAPEVYCPINHALLAYDGSLKAQEALFIAAYLAGQWKIPLDVVTVGDESETKVIREDAQSYLVDHEVEANYKVLAGDNAAEAILDYAHLTNIDCLLLGGYSRSPIMEIVQGGDVDEILRLTHIPAIVCR